MAKAQTPIRVDDDPQYQAALKPLADLKVKQSAIKTIIDKLQRETSPEDFQSAVSAIVGGADPIEAAANLDNQKALASARNSLALVTTAIARLQAAAEKELLAAQARYVDRVRPQYREVATQFATALIAFGRAQEAAIEFEMRCRADGLSAWPGSVEGPLFAQKLDDPKSPQDIFATFLTSFVACGVIDVAQVPAQWVSAWGLLAQIKKYGIDNLSDPERMTLTQMRGRAGFATSRAGLMRRQVY